MTEFKSPKYYKLTQASILLANSLFVIVLSLVLFACNQKPLPHQQLSTIDSLVVRMEQAEQILVQTLEPEIDSLKLYLTKLQNEDRLVENSSAHESLQTAQQFVQQFDGLRDFVLNEITFTTEQLKNLKNDFINQKREESLSETYLEIEKSAANNIQQQINYITQRLKAQQLMVQTLQHHLASEASKESKNVSE